MKLVIDKDIPFIKGVFEPYAEVVYSKGAEICRDIIKDADGLIIRTRTKCCKSLLEGTAVRFIASATIGTDHVDLPYCASRGIHFENAAGCNSSAVMQYVYTALYSLARERKIPVKYGPDGDFEEKALTIGVIGTGNVGSKVASLGEYLGFKVLRNDPPKQILQNRALERGGIRAEEAVEYSELNDLLERSDIVTLHVPLLESTESMADARFFGRMKRGTLFINSSRGEVVDENALLHYREKLSGLVLDVWNNEPEINAELVAAADIATPHIAGYSVEGKANGTLMAIKAAAGFFDIAALEKYEIPIDLYDPSLTPSLILKGKGCNEIFEDLYRIFPIFNLDKLLRNNISEFESIRSNYKLRREFHVYQQR